MKNYSEIFTVKFPIESFIIEDTVLKYDNLRGIYKEIAMETDLETVKKIHDMFAGQQIAFPKKLYSSEYINSFIKSNYDGKNTRELAGKFNISERRVRQILSKFK